MAIRTDIFSIDWSVSPRLIWIGIAFAEVSAQDFYDTVRFLEAASDGIDEPPIIDAGGGEPLGAGTKVGITVSLFNAQYAFEDRPGPEWVICNMAGGNVVAFTDKSQAVEIYPRYPTAFVSADRTASSSATTQEQQDIQYSSFNGGVTYDELSGVAGTDYPRGTPRMPVNNQIDAAIIATERGFTTGYIKGDATFDASVSFSNFTMIGEGKARSLITVLGAADVQDCTYVDAHVTGVLDGNSRLVDCLIDNLTYIKGFIEGCVLSAGIIQLGGAGIAHFLDCYSGVPGVGTATLDMAGSGQGLAMRNYNGGILLTNKTGLESVSIDLNSGQVKLDLDGSFGAAGITSGQIVVRGVGKVIDATTGLHLQSGFYGSLELINETVCTPCISDGVWGYER